MKSFSILSGAWGRGEGFELCAKQLQCELQLFWAGHPTIYQSNHPAVYQTIAICLNDADNILEHVLTIIPQNELIFPASILDHFFEKVNDLRHLMALVLHDMEHEIKKNFSH